nr:MAG TPA: hypothetical protein [Caudoviricetes sp.]
MFYLGKTQNTLILLYIKQLEKLRGKKHYDQIPLKRAVEVKNIMTSLPKSRKSIYYGKRKTATATIHQYSFCLHKVLQEPVIASANGID